MFTLSPSAREAIHCRLHFSLPLPAALFSFTQRLCGRATDPFFLVSVRSVGRSDLPPHALPHPDDP